MPPCNCAVVLGECYHHQLASYNSCALCASMLCMLSTSLQFTYLHRAPGQAQNAVHGAMAGFTGFSPGLCNNRMVFLPIDALVKNSPRGINPKGRTIERLLNLTHQPLPHMS